MIEYLSISAKTLSSRDIRLNGSRGCRHHCQDPTEYARIVLFGEDFFSTNVNLHSPKLIAILQLEAITIRPCSSIITIHDLIASWQNEHSSLKPDHGLI
jgi:hypothetical protein